MFDRMNRPDRSGICLSTSAEIFLVFLERDSFTLRDVRLNSPP